MINAGVKLNILIKKENSLAINTINLFTNSYVTELTPVDKQVYDDMHFESEPKLKSYDLDQI